MCDYCTKSPCTCAVTTNSSRVAEICHASPDAVTIDIPFANVSCGKLPLTEILESLLRENGLEPGDATADELSLVITSGPEMVGVSIQDQDGVRIVTDRVSSSRNYNSTAHATLVAGNTAPTVFKLGGHKEGAHFNLRFPGTKSLPKLEETEEGHFRGKSYLGPGRMNPWLVAALTSPELQRRWPAAETYEEDSFFVLTRDEYGFLECHVNTVLKAPKNIANGLTLHFQSAASHKCSSYGAKIAGVLELRNVHSHHHNAAGKSGAVPRRAAAPEPGANPARRPKGTPYALDAAGETTHHHDPSQNRAVRVRGYDKGNVDTTTINQNRLQLVEGFQADGTERGDGDSVNGDGYIAVVKNDDDDSKTDAPENDIQAFFRATK